MLPGVQCSGSIMKGIINGGSTNPSPGDAPCFPGGHNTREHGSPPAGETVSGIRHSDGEHNAGTGGRNPS